MNQKRRRSGADHTRREILLVVNGVFLIFLIISLIIPSKGKQALMSNIDISMYNDSDSIPVIGAVTDQRPAEIKFHLYGEKLYAICLYFYVGGSEDIPEDTDAKILCTLKAGEEQIGYTEVPMKELAALMSKDNLNAKELIFDCGESVSGEYTLLLEGQGIPAGVRVGLYGNNSPERRLEYVNAGYDKSCGILYSIEVTIKEYPFVWSAALIFALSFLFSCIIYMDDGERC